MKDKMMMEKSEDDNVEKCTSSSRITWEGCSVLLDINDGDRLVFARLSNSSTLKIGDKKCSLGQLIGCPFGSTFQLDSTGSSAPYLSRILVENNNQGDIDVVEGKNEVELKEESRDNRALVDNNSAQSLSGQDIDALRRQGATGDQIVEALIANSSTFEKKTLFSQEKYRIRKQKKYAPRVLLRRPFARSICEAYFKKYPARIGYLRMDTLSLLLSMANVSPYSDVLVVDMVGGILTGAVAERLGGTGYVCNTYFGVTQYPMDIVRIFNFNNIICSSIVRSPFSDLCLAASNNVEHFGQQENLSLQSQSNGDESSSPSLFKLEAVVIQNQVSSPSCLHSVSNAHPSFLSGNENLGPAPTTFMDETDSSSVSRVCKPTKSGEKATQEVINLWKASGFSSLIIAAPELDTWSTLQDLLPLLSYSAPFAVYHQYLQPLTTCMHNLQVAKLAIGLQISEPWLREYQVLPSRTHPCMQMSAFGGYILSGIKICSTEAQQKPE